MTTTQFDIIIDNIGQLLTMDHGDGPLKGMTFLASS